MEISGKTAVSKVTIPPKDFEITRLWFEADKNDSSMFYLWTHFVDNPKNDNFYRVFTKVKNTDKRYIATHLSTFSDQFFNGASVDFPMYKGMRSLVDNEKEYRFNKGDTVFLKISSIDSVSFKFWANYESEMNNAGNPFSGSGKNLNSNIEGGLGVWSGYNSTIYRIIAE